MRDAEASTVTASTEGKLEEALVSGTSGEAGLGEGSFGPKIKCIRTGSMINGGRELGMHFSKEAPDDLVHSQGLETVADTPHCSYIALRLWKATCGLVLDALCQAFTATIHVHLQPPPESPEGGSRVTRQGSHSSRIR